ncbi:VWA domain-containing protein [Candidatus Gottesmanbacteria bacterium]|nr:VWA domain-containing protein [Candidatus Gottesmanbacteria bacterium]
MKKDHLTEHGSINLIWIILLLLVVTNVIALVSIQLLVSVRRQVITAEVIKSEYAAESEVNDLLFKRVHNVNLGEFDTTTSYPGGVSVRKKGSEDGGNFTYTVSARYRNAASIVEATTTGGSTGTEIVVAIDCSSSMGHNAQPGGDEMWKVQRQSLLNFVNTAKANPNAQNIYIGLAGVMGEVSWLRISSSQTALQAKPTNDHDWLINLITTRLKDNDPGGGCNYVQNDNDRTYNINAGSANTGRGYTFAYAWFDEQTQTGNTHKKIAVTVTDGMVEGRTVDSRCPVSEFCNGGSACRPKARDFLRCAVAPPAYNWKPDRESACGGCAATLPGIRNPAYDSYGALIWFDAPVQSQNIFNNLNYFPAGKSIHKFTILEVSDFLISILDNIAPASSEITIRRKIP